MCRVCTAAPKAAELGITQPRINTLCSPGSKAELKPTLGGGTSRHHACPAPRRPRWLRRGGVTRLSFLKRPAGGGEEVGKAGDKQAAGALRGGTGRSARPPSRERALGASAASRLPRKHVVLPEMGRANAGGCWPWVPRASWQAAGLAIASEKVASSTFLGNGSLRCPD